MPERNSWAETENTRMAELQRARTLEALRPIVSDIGSSFGFQFYKVYKAPIPPFTSLRQLLLLTDLPDTFLDDFDRIGYTASELAQMRQIDRSQLTEWTVDQVLAVKDTDKNQQLRELLDLYGICRGVYVNIAPVDAPTRILSYIGRAMPLTVQEAEHLTLLSVQVLHRVSRLQMHGEMDKAGLTSLEIECLLLASQGHEAHEMGRRLGLSGRTVLYLINSICAKLDVSNIDQAVAEAIRCDFIG